MSEPNWADEAFRYAADLYWITQASARGVVASSHNGVSVVFAPSNELGPVNDGLNAEGIEVLGVAPSMTAIGHIAVLLVRSTDTPTLVAIITRGGDKA